MIIHQYPANHIHPYPTGEDILDPSEPSSRVWIPKDPMLVLGYSQEAERELNLPAVEARNIPVYKRRGGGGAVFLSQGTVCVALRLKRESGLGIPDYFSRANGRIQAVFKTEWNIELMPRGISDLAFGDRKVLGSSLYLPRDCAVYLASILIDVSIPVLDQLLRYPSREPDYRHGRSHAEFVRNLMDVPGLESTTPEKIRERLSAGLADNAD